MTTPTADAPRYVSVAFYSQYNLILLGGSALFSLASASPLPLLLGAAAELVWLGLGPRLPAFQRRVAAQLDGARRAHLDDVVLQGMRDLDPEHTSRLIAVGHNISWVLLRAESSVAGAAERSALLELEQLRPGFLRLCRLRQRIVQRLDELRAAPPEHEVAELSQAYAAEKDLGLRFTLHQAIKLAQRKIEQQARFGDVRRQIDLKLSMIEQSLAQLRNQQQLAGYSDLTRDIQGIASHVAGAAALEAELNEA
jgi:hypothetical protein